MPSAFRDTAADTSQSVAVLKKSSQGGSVPIVSKESLRGSLPSGLLQNVSRTNVAGLSMPGIPDDEQCRRDLHDRTSFKVRGEARGMSFFKQDMTQDQSRGALVLQASNRKESFSSFDLDHGNKSLSPGGGLGDSPYGGSLPGDSDGDDDDWHSRQAVLHKQEESCRFSVFPGGDHRARKVSGAVSGDVLRIENLERLSVHSRIGSEGITGNGHIFDSIDADSRCFQGDGGGGGAERVRDAETDGKMIPVSADSLFLRGLGERSGRQGEESERKDREAISAEADSCCVQGLGGRRGGEGVATGRDFDIVPIDCDSFHTQAQALHREKTLKRAAHSGDKDLRCAAGEDAESDTEKALKDLFFMRQCSDHKAWRSAGGDADTALKDILLYTQHHERPAMCSTYADTETDPKSNTNLKHPSDHSNHPSDHSCVGKNDHFNDGGCNGNLGDHSSLQRHYVGKNDHLNDRDFNGNLGDHSGLQQKYFVGKRDLLDHGDLNGNLGDHSGLPRYLILTNDDLDRGDFNKKLGDDFAADRSNGQQRDPFGFKALDDDNSVGLSDIRLDCCLGFGPSQLDRSNHVGNRNTEIDSSDRSGFGHFGVQQMVCFRIGHSDLRQSGLLDIGQSEWKESDRSGFEHSGEEKSDCLDFRESHAASFSHAIADRLEDGPSRCHSNSSEQRLLGEDSHRRPGHLNLCKGLNHDVFSDTGRDRDTDSLINPSFFYTGRDRDTDSLKNTSFFYAGRDREIHHGFRDSGLHMHDASKRDPFNVPCDADPLASVSKTRTVHDVSNTMPLRHVSKEVPHREMHTHSCTIASSLLPDVCDVEVRRERGLGLKTAGERCDFGKYVFLEEGMLDHEEGHVPDVGKFTGSSDFDRLAGKQVAGKYAQAGKGAGISNGRERTQEFDRFVQGETREDDELQKALYDAFLEFTDENSLKRAADSTVPAGKANKESAESLGNLPEPASKYSHRRLVSALFSAGNDVSPEYSRNSPQQAQGHDSLKDCAENDMVFALSEQTCIVQKADAVAEDTFKSSQQDDPDPSWSHPSLHSGAKNLQLPGAGTWPSSTKQHFQDSFRTLSLFPSKAKRLPSPGAGTLQLPTKQQIQDSSRILSLSPPKAKILQLPGAGGFSGSALHTLEKEMQKSFEEAPLAWPATSESGLHGKTALPAACAGIVSVQSRGPGRIVPVSSLTTKV